MIFYNCFIIVLRDLKKALFYHPQSCSEKLRNKARQETKLLQFLRTKWAPCDKGPSRALTDEGLRSQTITYFFTCCFWVISISRLLFWNNICNSNKNKFEQDWKFTSHSVRWHWGGLLKNTYAGITAFLVPNCYFCIFCVFLRTREPTLRMIRSV